MVKRGSSKLSCEGTKKKKLENESNDDLLNKHILEFINSRMNMIEKMQNLKFLFNGGLKSIIAHLNQEIFYKQIPKIPHPAKIDPKHWKALNDLLIEMGVVENIDVEFMSRHNANRMQTDKNYLFYGCLHNKRKTFLLLELLRIYVSYQKLCLFFYISCCTLFKAETKSDIIRNKMYLLLFDRIDLEHSQEIFDELMLRLEACEGVDKKHLVVVGVNVVFQCPILLVRSSIDILILNSQSSQLIALHFVLNKSDLVHSIGSVKKCLVKKRIFERTVHFEIHKFYMVGFELFNCNSYFSKKYRKNDLQLRSFHPLQVFQPAAFVSVKGITLTVILDLSGFNVDEVLNARSLQLLNSIRNLHQNLSYASKLEAYTTANSSNSTFDECKHLLSDVEEPKATYDVRAQLLEMRERSDDDEEDAHEDESGQEVCAIHRQCTLNSIVEDIQRIRNHLRSLRLQGQPLHNNLPSRITPIHNESDQFISFRDHYLGEKLLIQCKCVNSLSTDATGDSIQYFNRIEAKEITLKVIQRAIKIRSRYDRHLTLNTLFFDLARNPLRNESTLATKFMKLLQSYRAIGGVVALKVQIDDDMLGMIHNVDVVCDNGDSVAMINFLVHDDSSKLCDINRYAVAQDLVLARQYLIRMSPQADLPSISIYIACLNVSTMSWGRELYRVEPDYTITRHVYDVIVRKRIKGIKHFESGHWENKRNHIDLLKTFERSLVHTPPEAHREQSESFSSGLLKTVTNMRIPIYYHFFQAEHHDHTGSASPQTLGSHASNETSQHTVASENQQLRGSSPMDRMQYEVKINHLKMFNVILEHEGARYLEADDKYIESPPQTGFPRTNVSSILDGYWNMIGKSGKSLDNHILRDLINLKRFHLISLFDESDKCVSKRELRRRIENHIRSQSFNNERFSDVDLRHLFLESLSFLDKYLKIKRIMHKKGFVLYGYLGSTVHSILQLNFSTSDVPIFRNSTELRMLAITSDQYVNVKSSYMYNGSFGVMSSKLIPKSIMSYHGIQLHVFHKLFLVDDHRCMGYIFVEDGDSCKYSCVDTEIFHNSTWDMIRIRVEEIQAGLLSRDQTTDDFLRILEHGDMSDAEENNEEDDTITAVQEEQSLTQPVVEEGQSTITVQEEQSLIQTVVEDSVLESTTTMEQMEQEDDGHKNENESRTSVCFKMSKGKLINETRPIYEHFQSRLDDLVQASSKVVHGLSTCALSIITDSCIKLIGLDSILQPKLYYKLVDLFLQNPKNEVDKDYYDELLQNNTVKKVVSNLNTDPVIMRSKQYLNKTIYHEIVQIQASLKRFLNPFEKLSAIKARMKLGYIAKYGFSDTLGKSFASYYMYRNENQWDDLLNCESDKKNLIQKLDEWRDDMGSEEKILAFKTIAIEEKASYEDFKTRGMLIQYLFNLLKHITDMNRTLDPKHKLKSFTLLPITRIAPRFVRLDKELLGDIIKHSGRAMIECEVVKLQSGENIDNDSATTVEGESAKPKSLDSISLMDFYGVGDQYKEYALSQTSIQKLSDLAYFICERKNHTLESYFNFRKKKDSKLAPSFQVNGTEIHVTYVREIGFATNPSNTSPTRSNAPPGISYKCKYDVNSPWDLVSVDPNNHQWVVSCYIDRDGKTHIRKFTKSQWQRSTGFFKLQKMMRKYQSSDEYKNATKILQEKNLKTSDFGEINAGVLASMEQFDILYKYASKKSIMNYKFTIRGLRDRTMRHVLEYISYGGTKVIAYGDMSRSCNGIRGLSNSGPTLELQKFGLRNGYKIFAVDESFTSKRSHCCMGHDMASHKMTFRNMPNDDPLDRGKHKRKRKRKIAVAKGNKLENDITREIHGLRFCTNCRMTYSRDVVASINILRLAWDVARNLPRNIIYTKDFDRRSQWLNSIDQWRSF